MPPTTTLLDLSLTDIAEHPDNPRLDVGDVADLAKSIAEHGVLEPVIVAPWPEDLKGTPAQKKKRLLIAGHRRVAAAKKAKTGTVPAIARDDLNTRAKQLEAMLVENLHRADLTPIEEGTAYQGLLDLGLTQTALAKEVGQPASRIRERLKLAKLPDTVRGRVHTGQITITDALAVGEFADDEKAMKSLLKDAGTAGFRHALETARVERKEALERGKLLGEINTAGVKVVTKKPDGYRAIGTLFDKAPTTYAGEGLELHRWFLKNHADCPGAVVVDGRLQTWERPQLHYGCTQPKLHPKPVKKKSKAELAAEKKHADAIAFERTALAAATATRRAWLREECLQEATPGLATTVLLDHIFDVLCNEQVRGGQYAGAAAAAVCWALDLPEQTDLTDARALAEKLTLPALVVLWHFVENAYYDARLDGEAWQVYSAARWIRTVGTTYHYQWTDFELDRFKAYLGDGTPDADDQQPVKDHELPDGENAGVAEAEH